MKFITNSLTKLAYAFCVLVLCAITAFFALPYVDGFGALDLKIVKSGSMEPTIMTGAVVIIRERSAYGEGDTVTFTTTGSDIPTTHRIIGTELAPDGSLYFITKGDANEERDTELLAPENIIGKVVLDVPYLGFIFDFARQPIGFGLLVGIPALIIILDEVEKIYRELRRRSRVVVPVSYEDICGTIPISLARPVPRTARVVDMCWKLTERTTSYRAPAPVETVLTTRPTPFLRPAAIGLYVILAPFTMVSFILGGTGAFQLDREQATNNVLTAAAIDFTANPSTTLVTITDGESDAPVSVVLSPVLDSSAMRYTVTTSSVSGNLALCAGLRVASDVPVAYAGSLTEFSLTAVTAESLTLDDFSIAPDTVYQSGDTCVFDLVITGWSEDFVELFGYDDEERVQITISALNTPPQSEGARQVAPAAFVQEIIEEPVAEAGGEVLPQEEPTPTPVIEDAEEPEETAIPESPSVSEPAGETEST